MHFYYKYLILLCSFLVYLNNIHAQTPENDVCADAIPLTIGSFCTGDNTNGDNTGATDESLAAGSCFHGVNEDVWFTIMPSFDGTYRISTDYLGGTHTDTEVALYSGSCTNLTELACDQDGGVNVNYNSILSHALVANETYYLQVSGFGGQEGSFCVDVSPPLANDICANATTLQIGENCSSGVTNGDNSGAIDEGVTPASCFRGDNFDVWFKFTAINSTEHHLSTDFAGVGTNDDTEIALYAGNCGSLTELACDQDGGIANANNSLLDYLLVANEEYFIRVSGWNGKVGTFCLEITEVPPPPDNDDCADATEIVLEQACNGATGTTVSATSSPESTCGGAEVWHYFVAPDVTTISISATYLNSDQQPLAAIYSGECGSLTLINCGGSLDELQLNAGEQYYIAVATNGSYQGEYCLTITGITLDNDICEEAIPLTVGNTCTTGNYPYNIANANSEGIYPHYCSGANDAWYKFTVTEWGTYRFDFFNGSDPQFGIGCWSITLYSGECGDMQRNIKNYTFYNYLLPPDTYYLRVGGFSSDFCLEVTEVDNPPSNDLAEDPPMLTFGNHCNEGIVNGTTVGATDSTNDSYEQPAPDCFSNDINDVFFRSPVSASGYLDVKIVIPDGYSTNLQINIENYCYQHTDNSSIIDLKNIKISDSRITANNKYVPIRISGINGEETPFCIQVTPSVPAEACGVEESIDKYLVKDITPGSLAGINTLPAFQTAALGNNLIFFAGDEEHGTEPWRTDGSCIGTSMIKDLTGNYYSSGDPSQLAKLKDRAIFTGRAANGNSTVWITDGSAVGTEVLKTFITEGVSRIPQVHRFGLFQGILLTSGNNPTGFLAKKGKGEEYKVIDDILYFVEDDGTHGEEVWISDGTAAGTKLLKDIHAADNSAHPYGFTKFGDFVYFFAYDGTNWGIWKTDNTTSGTTLVAYLPEGEEASYPIANDDRLFFSYKQEEPEVTKAYTLDAAGNLNLLNAAGTLQNSEDFFEHSVTLANQVYFLKSDGLYKTDGTTVTQLVTENFTQVDAPIALFEDKVVALVYEKLVITDGTTNGTTDLLDGLFFISVNKFVKNPEGNKLYFEAIRNNLWAVWETDGTVAGTIPLDFEITDTSGEELLEVVGNKLYFEEDGELHYYQLEPNTCVETIEHGGIITTDTYHANQSIISTATIQGNVVYKAGNSITLNSNFTVEAGATFSAFIEDCDLPTFNNEAVEERSPENEAVLTEAQLKVFPNPLTSVTHLKVYLPQSGQCTISLIDINGKIIENIYHGYTERGWLNKQFSTTSLTPGVYIINMLYGEEVMAIRVIK